MGKYPSNTTALSRSSSLQGTSSNWSTPQPPTICARAQVPSIAYAPMRQAPYRNDILVLKLTAVPPQNNEFRRPYAPVSAGAFSVTLQLTPVQRYPTGVGGGFL